jgi:hypothetical protein
MLQAVDLFSALAQLPPESKLWGSLERLINEGTLTENEKQLLAFTIKRKSLDLAGFQKVMDASRMAPQQQIQFRVFIDEANAKGCSNPEEAVRDFLEAQETAALQIKLGEIASLSSAKEIYAQVRELRPPTGDRSAVNIDILGAYKQRATKRSDLIIFGSKYVDARHMILPTDFTVLAGFASQGKTNVVLKHTYSNITNFKSPKNVAFISIEFPYDITMFRLLSLHSRMTAIQEYREKLKFDLETPYRIPLTPMIRGELTEQQLNIFQLLADDLMTNPNYGRIAILDVPKGATLTEVISQLERTEDQMGVDFHLLVVDYLTLLGGPGRTRHEIKTEIIEHAKLQTLAYRHVNSGSSGLAITSPAQTSRDAFEKACDAGEYDMTCLGETSAWEKNVDNLITFLRTPEDEQNAEATMNAVKTRNGTVIPAHKCFVDFAHSFYESIDV